MGNKRAAERYCGKDAPRVAQHASKQELLDYCQKKYELKLWASPSSPVAAPAPAAAPSQVAACGGGGRPSCAPEAVHVNLLDLDTWFDAHSGARSPAARKSPGLVEDAIAGPIALRKDTPSGRPPTEVEAWPAPDAWPAWEMSSWPAPDSWPCKSGADDLTACFGASACKAAAQGPAREWQPTAPESDDLWADWGAW